MLYIWPASEGGSTTAILPRNYPRLYDAILADSKMVGSLRLAHYVELRRLSSADVLKGCSREHASLLQVPAGALLIWDSRLTHTGWLQQGARLAQPICWKPRARRDTAAWKHKLLASARGLSTSHSASERRLHSAHAAVPAPAPPTPASLRNDETYTLLPMLPPVGLRHPADAALAWDKDLTP